MTPIEIVQKLKEHYLYYFILAKNIRNKEMIDFYQGMIKAFDLTFEELIKEEEKK